MGACVATFTHAYPYSVYDDIYSGYYATGNEPEQQPSSSNSLQASPGQRPPQGWNFWQRRPAMVTGVNQEEAERRTNPWLESLDPFTSQEFNGPRFEVRPAVDQANQPTRTRPGMQRMPRYSDPTQGLTTLSSPFSSQYRPDMERLDAEAHHFAVRPLPPDPQTSWVSFSPNDTQYAYSQRLPRYSHSGQTLETTQFANVGYYSGGTEGYFPESIERPSSGRNPTTSTRSSHLAYTPNGKHRSSHPYYVSDDEVPSSSGAPYSHGRFNDGYYSRDEPER